MTVGQKAPAQPSFKERMTGWLPSLPSLPSIPKIPSWSSCKGSFQALGNCIQSSAPSLSKRTCIVLTVTAGACMAIYESCFKTQESQLIEGESASQALGLTFFDTLVTPLTYYVGQKLLSNFPHSASALLTYYIGQKLLSDLPLASATAINCSIMGTEEVSLSQSFRTWDIFPFENQGRLITSTTSLHPSGVDLLQSQMQSLGSISLPASILGIPVNRENAIYLSSINSGILQIYNIKSLSNPYVSNIVDTGTIVQNMIASGENLFLTGANTLLKSFDISDPFNPQFRGAALNSSITGNAFAQSPVGNQFGCATNKGFFYINGTNFEVTGMIPLGSSFTVAASEDCYFIGTNAGLVSVTATPSSIPISTLPITNIFQVIYENGYCLIAAFNKLLVVDVQNPNAMKVVYTYPTSVISLLPSGNFLYYSDANGIGIFDKTNITNPLNIATGVLPQLANNALFSSDSENTIITTGSNSGNRALSFFTNQDSFTFTGTPQAGSKGISSVTLQAKTLNGNLINETQICNFNFQPAITPNSPIPKLIAAVSQIFSYTIAANAFKHVLGSPLSYTLQCPPGNQVTNTLRLTSTGQFYIDSSTGAPQIGNIGNATCYVQASDSLTATSAPSTVQIEVTEPPTLSTINNQIAITGEPFYCNITGTATKPSNAITFSASNLPPSFSLVQIDSKTAIITGIPSVQGTYSPSVTITESLNSANNTNIQSISTTQSFTLNVNSPGAPVFVQQLSTETAYTTSTFAFEIPPNMAVNQNNPNAIITYSASLSDGSPLPKWVSFDGKTFSCTPTVLDKAYNDVTIDIVVKATQNLPNGQQVTVPSFPFKIVLTGLSYGQILLAILGPIGSGLTIYRLFRKPVRNKVIQYPRLIAFDNAITALFQRRCSRCKPIRFPQTTTTFIEGHKLEFRFNTPANQISRLKVFYNNIVGPLEGQLPKWLDWKVEDNLFTISTESVPQLKGVNSIEIVAKNKIGYKMERVTFHRSETPNSSTQKAPAAASADVVSVELAPPPPPPAVDSKDENNL